MITVALLAAVVGLPVDVPPDPEPLGSADTADWVLPVVIGGAVLLVLAVAAVVVVLRRRQR